MEELHVGEGATGATVRIQRFSYEGGAVIIHLQNKPRARGVTG
ncbi:unnamed protein product [Linum tenue]|uniref:Uncharacterized protein n=1 Tax=Linum tenue TaxID=586396 RepID=A0AAV0IXC8_9ROSI|nr:unnamed protein product [Linum tenue]